MQNAPPPHEDLSDWLQEAGKRRFVQSGPVEIPAIPAGLTSPLTSPRPAAAGKSGKWLVFSAVTAIAYLQYFYADVFLQIITSPSIIFFVLAHGQLPPM